MVILTLRSTTIKKAAHFQNDCSIWSIIGAQMNLVFSLRKTLTASVSQMQIRYRKKIKLLYMDLLQTRTDVWNMWYYDLCLLSLLLISSKKKEEKKRELWLTSTFWITFVDERNSMEDSCQWKTQHSLLVSPGRVSSHIGRILRGSPWLK